LFVLLVVSYNLKCSFYLGIREIYTNVLIIELYEPGLGVKKFGGSDDFQSFLGCFWNNLQIHIKAETTAPFEKEEREKRFTRLRRRQRRPGINETADEHE
jgi:hypothetical protein